MRWKIQDVSQTQDHAQSLGRGGILQSNKQQPVVVNTATRHRGNAEDGPQRCFKVNLSRSRVKLKYEKFDMSKVGTSAEELMVTFSGQ